MSGVLPPGWPRQVRPADTPGWQESATGWLFDQCPGDYRDYDVLRRYPAALARMAGQHVAAATEAARRGLATARSDLAGVLPPEALEATVSMYERELARLGETRRAVELVDAALRGERYVPRL